MIYLLLSNVKEIPFRAVDKFLKMIYENTSNNDITEILRYHFDWLKEVKNKDVKNYVTNRMAYLTIEYLQVVATQEKISDNLVGITSGLTILLSIYNQSHKHKDMVNIYAPILIQCMRLQYPDVNV